MTPVGGGSSGDSFIAGSFANLGGFASCRVRRDENNLSEGGYVPEGAKQSFANEASQQAVPNVTLVAVRPSRSTRFSPASGGAIVPRPWSQGGWPGPVNE